MTTASTRAAFVAMSTVTQTGELVGFVHGLDGEGNVARGEREGREIIVEPDIGGVVAQTHVEFLSWCRLDGDILNLLA